MDRSRPYQVEVRKNIHTKKEPTSNINLTESSYLCCRVVLGIIHQLDCPLLLFSGKAAAFGDAAVITEGGSEWAAEPAAEPQLPSLAPCRNPQACPDSPGLRRICRSLDARKHHRRCSLWRKKSF